MASVIHFTSVHQAFDSRIFHKECVSLAQAGFEVTLIAPHDRDEDAHGVQIVGVPKPTSRVERMTKTVWNVYRAVARTDANLYHFHDPELIGVGLLLKLRGKTVVFDAHEYQAREVLHGKGYIPKALRPPISWAVGAAEAFACRHFDGLVTVADAIAASLPCARTAIVRNYPILGEIAASDPPPLAARPQDLLFLGTIDRAYCVPELIDAMDLLGDFSKARLVLAGKFVEPALKSHLERSEGWKRVVYRGWLDREAVRHTLHTVRAGLMLCVPRPDYVELSTRKLYEFMAAGLPVIASDIPSWRRSVEEWGCGIVIDSTTPQGIADGIRWIFEHPDEAAEMGDKGRRATLKELNWDSQAQALLKLYDELGVRP